MAALNRLSEKIDRSSESKEQMDILKDENKNLRIEIVRLQSELKAANQMLEDRSNELAIERSLRSSSERPDTAVPEKPVLVIGSSIIRDLDEKLYRNTKVEAASGAVPKGITTRLEQHHKNGKCYEKIVIVAGGNQLDYDGTNTEKSISETIDDLKVTVDTAKLLTKNVAVCQLPPRTHTPRAAEIIDSFNGLLPTELECDIISTRESFYLADRTPNDGYLDKDQVHLNLRGSTKLVKCMGLAARDPNNPVLVNKKAAYNGDTQQEPSARKGQNKQSQPRASYAQAAKKKTTGPNDRQEMRTKPRTENTTREMDPPAMTRNLQANKDIPYHTSPSITARIWLLWLLWRARAQTSHLPPWRPRSV